MLIRYWNKRLTLYLTFAAFGFLYLLFSSRSYLGNDLTYATVIENATVTSLMFSNSHHLMKLEDKRMINK
jgi:hypothetical protein